MKQPLPEIYKNRSKLLRLSLDKGLSASELNQLVDSMDGKSEEEKESIAAELILKLKVGEIHSEGQT